MNRSPDAAAVYVIGAGGHAKVVIDTMRAAQIPVAGILEDDNRRHTQPVLGTQIIGDTALLRQQPATPAVIAVGDNSKRRQLAERLPKTNWITVIHPRTVIAGSVSIGVGTVIFAGAIIQPDTQIGAHTIVNTGATIDHDCRLDDYVHLAPGSHLCGTVTVGEGAIIGAGAVVLPGISIGAGSIIGAGATVIRDVPPLTTVVGIPAHPL